MLVINKHPLMVFVTCQENGCLDGLEGPVVINIWSIELGCEQGSVAGFGDRWYFVTYHEVARLDAVVIDIEEYKLIMSRARVRGQRW